MHLNVTISLLGIRQRQAEKNFLPSPVQRLRRLRQCQARGQDVVDENDLFLFERFEPELPRVQQPVLI
jgi:hypothetical protein